MRIAVHTVAGKQVGFGHLRRCLTLAEALRAHGADVVFRIDGDVGLVGRAGFEVTSDDVAVDATIADSYQLDAAWFSAMRRRARLLVIDDLADRLIDADLVTNSAVGAAALPYRTADDCQLLLGPSYALVRRGFREAAHATRAHVERVLVTLGGSDPGARTCAVVAALQAVLSDAVCIDVVIGPFHGEDEPLDDLVRKDPRVILHRNVTDLAPLVALADLAVSAGGQTTFELAAAGVPAVSLAVAENQRQVLAGFAQAGVLVHSGDASAPDLSDRLRASVSRVVTDEALRRAMSDAGRGVVDGRGADRVATALLAQIRV